MTKTFAKITKTTKTFFGLLATIVVKGRRLVLIFHLEAKYAKMDCKNEIYAKNWIRSIGLQKVNSGKKSTIKPPKVNSQTSKSQMMTSAVDASKCRQR